MLLLTAAGAASQPAPVLMAPPSVASDTQKPSHTDVSARTTARSWVHPPALRDAPTGPRASNAAQPIGPRAEDGGLALGVAGGEPQLRRRADGSYSFDGQGIRAVIHENGDVSFTDKVVSDPQVEAEAPIAAPVQAVQPKDGGKLGVTIIAVAALTTKLDLIGPHSAERRWFLERTQLLRQQLVQNDARRKLDQLSGVLERIWSAKSVSFAQRRRQTFDLWDALSEDDLGTRARAMITARMKRRCPRGSGCAFSAAELDHFNRARRSQAPFAPYSEPASAQPTASE